MERGVKSRTNTILSVYVCISPGGFVSWFSLPWESRLAYTRMTAKSVHEQLKANAVEKNQHVPAERTVHDILNRLGYRLRPVLKTKPKKKIPKQAQSSTT